MELPYRFVAHRGLVSGAFTSYNNVLLDCMERREGKDMLAFLKMYWERSKDSDVPVVVELPIPLQVRVGNPVLSVESIVSGQRSTNYVWYDGWTDNLCTFDYSNEKGIPDRFVCVLDSRKVPGWLRSGCYRASYCVECSKECWAREFDLENAVSPFAVGSRELASVVITLEKYERPLPRAVVEMHAVQGTSRDVVGPFPRSLGEFVESFRQTFNI